MRRTIRLLASVKPTRFLEAGSPTGLTGLFTHPAPRSTLIYLYTATIDKLKAFPEDSVYRQSVEGICKHRLAIVNKVVPAGFDEWAQRASEIVAQYPDAFNAEAGQLEGKYVKSVIGGQTFVNEKLDRNVDDLTDEWDGEIGRPLPEGPQPSARRSGQVEISRELPKTDVKSIQWDPEPPLNAEQIDDIETQIGAGLIEEVIVVAEAELELVDVMAKHEIWSDLEEKPAEGQWEYFKRDSGTPETQAPPKL